MKPIDRGAMILSFPVLENTHTLFQTFAHTHTHTHELDVADFLFVLCRCLLIEFLFSCIHFLLVLVPVLVLATAEIEQYARFFFSTTFRYESKPTLVNKYFLLDFLFSILFNLSSSLASQHSSINGNT